MNYSSFLDSLLQRLQAVDLENKAKDNDDNEFEDEIEEELMRLSSPNMSAADVRSLSKLLKLLYCNVHSFYTKGGFPVITEITCKIAGNARRQFFFVITTTASIRCLVENFQPVCYWK